MVSKTTSKNIRNSGFLEADGYKDMKAQTFSDRSYFNLSYFRLCLWLSLCSCKQYNYMKKAKHHRSTLIKRKTPNIFLQVTQRPDIEVTAFTCARHLFIFTLKVHHCLHGVFQQISLSSIINLFMQFARCIYSITALQQHAG